MNKDVLIGSAILLLISIIVRIMPTFLKIKLSEQTIDNIKNILPIAVFINLLTYCVASEGKEYAIATAAGFSVLVILILLKRINLLLMVVLASVAYMAIR